MLVTIHYLWHEKMRQTEDPFYGNLVQGVHRRSSLWGLTVAWILRGILTNHYFFYLRNWLSNDQENFCLLFHVSLFCILYLRPGL